MTFDPTLVSNFFLILTGFGGAFIAALWISLVIWTYRDIRTRARDPLVQTLATLLVAVLNLPGVLVYLILRPQRTLEEEYQRTLEEEALLQALEDLPLCPGCERRVKDDWQVCPNCHTRYDQKREIDRASMRMYKHNLGILNNRYGEIERRLFSLLARTGERVFVLGAGGE